MSNLRYLHDNFPIHFIIETAPFILGIMAFFCGRFIDKIHEKNAEIIETSRFRDNFLASMSHEIRTPMTGIIGVIDLLGKSAHLNGTDHEYVDIIKRSSQDLMGIINDILDLSKLKEDKLQIITKPTDVRKTCLDIKNLFLAISRSKKIGLVLDVADNVPDVLSLDMVRIKQILSNLVGNALKFSDGGTVTVRITAANLSDNKATIKFEVSDEGQGIEQQKMDMIFSAYRQIENYSDSHINGTGLGLFICKRLVELMNGTMGAESEFDKGSNFWFTIETEVLSDLPVVTADVKDLSTDAALKPLNLQVLVVDDNKTLCAVFKGMLQKMRCHVTTAYDGFELIEVFKENVYDIILLDINMPKMGGLEAMQYLRNNFDDVPPIICSTASAFKEDIDKYMALGFDDYITKPFTANQLMAKLEKWENLGQSNNVGPIRTAPEN